MTQVIKSLAKKYLSESKMLSENKSPPFSPPPFNPKQEADPKSFKIRDVPLPYREEKSYSLINVNKACSQRHMPTLFSLVRERGFQF